MVPLHCVNMEKNVLFKNADAFESLQHSPKEDDYTVLLMFWPISSLTTLLKINASFYTLQI